MKIIARIVVVALSALALALPGPVAAAGGHSRPAVVPADRVAGNSGGDLLGDWFVENLSRPVPESPFGGTTNLCLDLGRRGKVLVPAGGLQDPDTKIIEMTCTVQVGRPIVVIMDSSDCSTAEAPPYQAFGAGPQRACALSTLGSIPLESIVISLDQARPVDIYRPRFLEVSPQRHVVFPENPVFATGPGPATFVAAAWMAELQGLRRGSHTMVAKKTYGDGSVNTFIVHFDVVGKHRHS